MRVLGGEMQREEAESAADVEDLAGRRQVLPDLVEKPQPQDHEADRAVDAHDGIVIRLDDPPERCVGCGRHRHAD